MNHVSTRRGMRQRGSILLQASVVLLVCVIALAGTELGYLFFVKREMQKAADLSALAGAQTLALSGCTAGGAAATTNATQNLQSIGFTPTITPTCGTWDAASTAPQRFVAGGSQPNALKVLIAGTGPTLLPFLKARTVATEAIAANGQPLAAFSVGSRLARVTGDSALGAALKGIGLNPAISLVSYDGLANAKITPGGLLGALGIPVTTDINVGQLNALLAANQVGLGQLLDAAVTLAGQSALTAANVTLLNAIKADVGNIPLNVKLGSNTTPPTGLFASVVAPDATTSSALNTQISALDLISTAIGVATSNHAVEVKNLSVLGNAITAKVGIIEPPSIGIGGVGATAYTAQVRAFAHLSTANLPLLGGLMSNFAMLDLPLILDVASGRGTIAEMCTPALRNASGKDQARINVNAEILKVCVGGVDESALFSTKASCETGLQNKQLLKVGLLGVNVVDLTTKFQVNPLPGNGSATLAEGEIRTVGNDLLLGTTVKDITDGFLTALIGNALSQGKTAPPNAAQQQAIAQDLFGSPPCTSSACRKSRLQQAKDKIDSSSTGLGGLVGSLTPRALDIVGQLVSLNISGLLNSLGGLVTGLLNAVGDLLGGLLGGLVGNSCTGGLLFGSGTDAGCVTQISNSLNGSSGSGATQTPNSAIALVGFLLNVLKPLLNGVGTAVLTPLLQNILGLHLGETDVNMLSLQCGGTARLVY